MVWFATTKWSFASRMRLASAVPSSTVCIVCDMFKGDIQIIFKTSSIITGFITVLRERCLMHVNVSFKFNLKRIIFLLQISDKYMHAVNRSLQFTNMVIPVALSSYN